MKDKLLLWIDGPLHFCIAYHLQKMYDFENRVDNYITFNPEFDGADKEQRELLDAITSKQVSIIGSATVMFESHESGDLDLDTVLAFEKNIDEIVPLLDELIVSEIEDINQRVHDIAKIVNESSDDD